MTKPKQRSVKVIPNKLAGKTHVVLSSPQIGIKEVNIEGKGKYYTIQFTVQPFGVSGELNGADVDLPAVDAWALYRALGKKLGAD